MDLFLVLYIFTVALTVLFIDMHNLVYETKLSPFWSLFSIFTVLFLIIKELRPKRDQMKVNNSLEFIDECS